MRYLLEHVGIMTMDPPQHESERVLVSIPIGQEAEAACKLLDEAGLLCEACSDFSTFMSNLEAGAGAAVLSEEAFAGVDTHRC